MEVVRRCIIWRSTLKCNTETHESYETFRIVCKMLRFFFSFNFFFEISSRLGYVRSCCTSKFPFGVHMMFYTLVLQLIDLKIGNFTFFTEVAEIHD